MLADRVLVVEIELSWIGVYFIASIAMLS